MKGASIKGYGEPFVSTRIQEVGGKKKLSAKLLSRSNTSGIYKENNSAINQQLAPIDKIPIPHNNWGI